MKYTHGWHTMGRRLCSNGKWKIGVARSYALQDRARVRGPIALIVQFKHFGMLGSVFIFASAGWKRLPVLGYWKCVKSAIKAVNRLNCTCQMRFTLVWFGLVLLGSVWLWCQLAKCWRVILTALWIFVDKAGLGLKKAAKLLEIKKIFLTGENLSNVNYKTHCNKPQCLTGNNKTQWLTTSPSHTRRKLWRFAENWYLSELHLNKFIAELHRKRDRWGNAVY